MSFKVIFIFSVVFLAAINLSHQGRQNIVEVSTKQVFDIVVLRNNQRPVVVYYTRPSCGRGICAKIQADLEDLARDNSDKIDLAIVDLDKNPDLKETFEIAIIPSTRVFYRGNMEGMVRGPVWNSINNLVQRFINK